VVSFSLNHKENLSIVANKKSGFLSQVIVYLFLILLESTEQQMAPSDFLIQIPKSITCMS